MPPTIASWSPSSRRRSSTCCTCRASGPRPWRRSTASSTSARSTISSRRPPTAASAALRGMGAKKEALILKALEERKRHAGRHLLPDTHEAAAALVAYLRERAPAADIDAGRQPAARLRHLRRPRHPRVRRRRVADGRLRRLPAGRAGARPRRHQVERARCAAAFRPTCGWSPPRAAAPRCSTSPDRRPTTSRCAIARSASASS